jgi:hypothetical protein
MASSGSIFNQRLRETVGLASVTKDVDLTAAAARLAELQGDVSVLRKVLETYNKALNTQVGPLASVALGGGWGGRCVAARPLRRRCRRPRPK